MIIDRWIFQKHLEEGESVFFVAHKHWVAVLKPVLKGLFFGFLIPWLIYAIFPPIFLFAIFWSIVGFIRILYSVIDWYCDAWLITSNGIIDLEWKGIFDHTSSRIEYGSVEGISYVIRGFWGTVLKFGDTQIDKVSSSTPTVLERASNPKNIELRILEYKNLFEDKKGKQDSDGIKQILSDMVVRYIKENGVPNISEEDSFEEDGSKIRKIEIQTEEEGEEEEGEEENAEVSAPDEMTIQQNDSKSLETPFTIKKL